MLLWLSETHVYQFHDHFLSTFVGTYDIHGAFGESTWNRTNRIFCEGPVCQYHPKVGGSKLRRFPFLLYTRWALLLVNGVTIPINSLPYKWATGLFHPYAWSYGPLLITIGAYPAGIVTSPIGGLCNAVYMLRIPSKAWKTTTLTRT